MSEARSAAEEIRTGRGYAILEGILSLEEASELRNRVLALAEEDRAKGSLIVEGKRERVQPLIGRDEAIDRLPIHPRILAVAEQVLGAGFTMNSCLDAHIVREGGMPMGAHVDYPYFKMEEPLLTEPILEMQVIFLMGDLAEENGPPRFVPGSQKLGRKPDETFDANAELVLGKAGSVVVSHGLCWHDTSENRTKEPRVNLLANFGPPYIRPMEDRTALIRAVGPDADPELLHLLGVYL